MTRFDWLKDRKTRRQLLVLILCGCASKAMAYNFELTEAEFLSWPSYCKVVYTHTQVGEESGFERLVSSVDRVTSRDVLNRDDRHYGGFGAHHFCAGSIWLSRARVQSDPDRKEFELERAYQETMFSFRHTEPTHFFYPQTATQLALILFEKGRGDEAFDLLNRAIEAKPSDARAYLLKGTIYYKDGNLEKARDVYLHGIQNTSSRSADLLYNLGLVLVKLGEPAHAAKYAREAYSLGFPLPGLRDKLKSLGYWAPPEGSLGEEE